MNNLLWSILVNRLATFGESYATASAYVLTLVNPNQVTDAAAALTAQQSAMTTFAALPVANRQASWYIFDAPFQDAGTNLAPAGLPNQTGNAGKALETDGVNATWTAVSSGGITGVGAFGAAPTANGAIVSGSNLVLEPADGTHPGALTSGAQTIGGVKTFAGTDATSSVIVSGSTVNHNVEFIPSYVSGNGFRVGNPSLGTFFECNSASAQIRAPAGGSVIGIINSVNSLILNPTNLDLTGLGVGGSIKLKSPDGTTYTLSVANGGTLSIV